MLAVARSCTSMAWRLCVYPGAARVADTLQHGGRLGFVFVEDAGDTVDDGAELDAIAEPMGRASIALPK